MSGRIVEYMILYDAEPFCGEIRLSLAEQVNNAIADGWEPTGGLCTLGTITRIRSIKRWCVEKSPIQLGHYRATALVDRKNPG